MKNKLIYLCLTFFILFGGCKSKSNNPVVPDNPVLPDSSSRLILLTEGNYWAYIDSVVGYPRLTDSSVVKISGSQTIFLNGNAYKAALWYQSPVHVNQITDRKYLYWNGDDGLYFLGGFSSTDTLVIKCLYLKYPAKIGDRWQVPRIFFSRITNKFFIQDTLTYDCVATNEKFETFVGTFNCYVYHWRERPEPDVEEYWEIYEYYAPNIGRVGYVVKGSLNDRTLFKGIMYDYFVK